jgi:CobQ-like glutamine amidotransferase family enzyme
VLARNPALADHVLEIAIGRELSPLPRADVDELRRQRLHAVRRLSR